ncbi:MAG TPA: hypothetical protein VFZ65_03920 [Planctomycetota bacterium]|nr:hypothetical protein [Planctomycetota bacterium]
MDQAPGRLARAAAAMLGLALASCYSSVGAWTYPSGRYTTTASPQPAPAFVLVEPLLDERGHENVSSMTWSYVPVFPLGWNHFDRPEATVPGPDTTQYRVEPCLDLARSIVIELQRQHLVERAEFARDYQHGLGETHRLRGRLRAFSVDLTRWTYGLSVYAPVLWSLGLPQATSKNAFCVDLELVEVASQRVVWSASLFDADSWVEGYYYGPDWYRFSWMWERRLRAGLLDLARVLGATAAPLPSELRDELELFPAQMPEELQRTGQEGR